MYYRYRYKSTSSADDSKINQINIPFITEKAIRAVLWKEFGIGPQEYPHLDPEWVSMMMSAFAAESRVKNEELKPK